MRSTQKSFIDKMRKTVLSLNALVEQSDEAYRRENDTHNHLKQVVTNRSTAKPHGDRERGWLEGLELSGAQNDWLLALVSKEETRSTLVATIAELKELAQEAIASVASAGEGNDEYVRTAKVLTVLASAILFKAEQKNELLLVEKPRLSVDDILQYRYPGAVHEFRVTHCKQ